MKIQIEISETEAVRFLELIKASDLQYSLTDIARILERNTEGKSYSGYRMRACSRDGYCASDCCRWRPHAESWCGPWSESRSNSEQISTNTRPRRG
jgi:hypothetical protein